MAAFKKVFSDRPFTGAVSYVVFLYIFEEWLFDFPQAKFLQLTLTFFSRNEVLNALLSTATSFLLFSLFIWISLRSSRAFQVLYTVLLALSLLIEYGYWKAVDRFLIPADLRIAAATPMNTWMGASELFFDWRFLVPVIVFICLLFLFSEREMWKPSLLRFGCIVLSFAGFTVVQSLIVNPLNLGPSLPSFYQTISRFAIEKLISHEREMVNYQRSDSPRNNIVLVIDESIRGDHLSINGYERETTPFLRSLSTEGEGFHSFGLAVAGATCSYSSNALILTGVRPGREDFELTQTYPTLFQYAKAAGYRTYYMDAQTNSLWNGLADEDMSFIDSWLKARDFGNDLQSDFRAADKIVEVVSQGTGNFIVLNKRGVHFLYEDSYPATSAVWLPLPDNYESELDLISNPYDNGILYNVNTFFERLLIDPGILENTTILYTSDHGQTLFENQASWLHCNYTPQEATVPLIVLGRNQPSIKDSMHASHSNIFPTVLELMAVPANQWMHSYSSSLFSLAEYPKNGRFFFDGSLRVNRFPDP